MKSRWHASAKRTAGHSSFCFKESFNETNEMLVRVWLCVVENDTCILACGTVQVRRIYHVLWHNHTVAPNGELPSPNLFFVVASVPVCCFHHSNETGCSQLFVIFRDLQENVVFVRAVICCVFVCELCKRPIMSKIQWQRMSNVVEGKCVVIDSNRKVLCALCCGTVLQLHLLSCIMKRNIFVFL